MLPRRFPSSLETQRLILRPLRQREDAQVLHPHITDSITRFWIDWDTPQSLAATQARVDEALTGTETGLYAGWLVYPSHRKPDEPDSLVGFISVEHLKESVRGANFELNFWVTEAAWGNRYATEMVRRVLDWLYSRTNIRWITFSWTQGNEASRRVIERVVGIQQPEVRLAIKNRIEVPVYHYVLDLNYW